MRTIHLCLAGVVLASACTTLTPKPAAQFEAARTSFHQPDVRSVVIVIFENKDESAVRAQPYFGRLVTEGAYCTRYFAVAHPSQPNYVAMISGSTDGVRGDHPARLTRPHLGQQLRDWMVYAEGYPAGTCDLRPRIGRYARKHVPFLSFADVQDDSELCKTHVTDFAAFLTAARSHTLPSFSLVIPDMDHDAHDQPLAVADEWLRTNFAPLREDPLFNKDVLLIVTFDEDDTDPPYVRNRRNNHIYTVFLGDSVVPGMIDTPYDHYDLLRTVEEIFHLQPMAHGDGSATVIGGMWR
jgi:acid phosphatase